MKIPTEYQEAEPEPKVNTWESLSKKAFFESIKEIIKIEPITARDTAVYIFKFNVSKPTGNEGSKSTEIIEISVSDFMRSHNKFEDLLFSHLDITLPKIMKSKSAAGELNEWSKFVQLCGKLSKKVPPSESTEWAECDRFLEIVAGFPIFEESQKAEWGANSRVENTLLKKTYDDGTFYCLKAKDVAKLCETLKIVIARKDMGSTMKARGIKREGEGLVRVGKQVIRAWCFTEESLIEHGMEFEEGKIKFLGMEELYGQL